MADADAQEFTQQKNNMAVMDSDYIKLRLDTQKLHTDILNFLQGTTKIVKLNKETNEYYEEIIATGQELANQVGIQNILSFVVSICNPHTIQGNTEKEELMKILFEMEMSLAERLTLNYEAWGIDEDNRDHIIDTLMHMIRLILSRTIDNKERDSYAPTIEKVSNYYSKQNKGLKL